MTNVANHIQPECGCSVYTSGDYLKVDHCHKDTEAIRADERTRFIKLVKILAKMNATVENLAEAIIEDVEYGSY